MKLGSRAPRSSPSSSAHWHSAPVRATRAQPPAPSAATKQPPGSRCRPSLSRIRTAARSARRICAATLSSHLPRHAVQGGMPDHRRRDRPGPGAPRPEGTSRSGRGRDQLQRTRRLPSSDPPLPQATRAQNTIRYLIKRPLPVMRALWHQLQILSSLESGVPSTNSAPVRIYGRDLGWLATQHTGADLTPGNLAHDVRVALESPSG